MRKAIAGIWSALIALPAPLQFVRVLCATARAANAIWPTAADEIRATRIFVREQPFELGDRELMDWFGLFACHEAFPSSYGRILARLDEEVKSRIIAHLQEQRLRLAKETEWRQNYAQCGVHPGNLR
jgi:hypothetical protein